MTSTTWTGDFDDADAPDRAARAPASAWLIARWLLCAAVFGLAVAIPFGFNYEWNSTKGWYYVAFALMTSTLAPSMVSSVMSRNIGFWARLFCAALMIGCLCYDWSNAARVHAAKQDTDHSKADFSKSESDNSASDRKRLEREIESLDKAADYLPVSKLEADLAVARARYDASWETYTVRNGGKVAHLRSRPQRYKDAVTVLEGKVASAKDREAKKTELKNIHGVEAAPSVADSGIRTAEKVLGWVGVHDLDDATLSRILALYDTGLMQLLCLVGPHGMFLFLFGALAPDAAQRRRLQEARDRAAKQATREAKRSVRTAMWRRWRNNASAKVKDAFARRKAPVYMPEPEPEIEAETKPARSFADMFSPKEAAAAAPETAVEPPVKEAPKAVDRHECDDSAVEAIANSRLQKESGRRVTTKDVFEKVWSPWHKERGLDPGEQRGMTDRLKASGLFETFPGGGKTWVVNWTIRAKTARPKLRVVG